MKLIYNKKYFLFCSVGILFLLCSFFHFLYQLSNECMFIAMIAPINESIFEHTKMIPIPLIGWWLTMLYIYREKIRHSSWLTSALLSLIVSIGMMVSLYYLYTGMFGIESLIIDIFILFIALFTGQWLGFHYYHYNGKAYGRLAVAGMIIFLLILTVLTFFPIDIPFFIDPTLTISWFFIKQRKTHLKL